MSNPGYHAADDGSLARSTGGAAARGAMLIALALFIGLLLMAFALDDPQTDLSTASADNVEETTTDDAQEAASEDAEAAEDPPGGDTGVSVVEPTDSSTTTEAPDAAETIPPVADGEARPPSEVIVLVANGTGGRGVAGAVSDKLTARSYIATVSNAPSTAEAVIYYRVGYDADARAVAEILGSPPDIIKPAPGDGTIAVSADAASDGRLLEANIVVIIGADNNVPTS